MTPDDLAAVAKHMAELSAAAKQDWLTANPADIGLNGIVVLHWREAYLEGCKDMANKVFDHLPKPLQDGFAKAFRAAMDAETERLKALP